MADKKRSAWNKGIPWSQAVKDKISRSKKANPTRYWLGKKLSKETKEKLSEAQKGTKKPWVTKCRLGKKLSKETKKRVSQGLLGKRHSQETKRKIGEARKGMKFSEEHKMRISKALTGKKLTKEHIKNSLRWRGKSSLEKLVDGVIKKHGLPYKFVGDGSFLIGRKNPDFVNTNGEKTAVEVYCKRHKDLFRGGCDEWKEARSALFAKYGWSIIYVEDWQTNDEKLLLSILK